MMNRITEVVKNLLIINVVIYFAARYILEWNLAMYYPFSEAFEPYQVISHMFMHGSEMHLFFNMLMLYFLGPYVENRIGSKRFLILYFFSGLGAILMHFGVVYYEINFLHGVDHGVVGASGALYGVLVAFAYLFPDVKLMLLFPPIPIKAKIFVPLLIAFDLFSGISGGGNIAHFAHIGGAIFGFAIIYHWYKKRKR